MKWFAVAALGLLAAIPTAATAQEVLPIGNIPYVDDTSTTVWGMSGMPMITITRTVNKRTPIMRSLTLDARTVEILSRTQAPPLSGKDIRTLNRDGRSFIVVRRYLLFEVMPDDARAAGKSKAALAADWAAGVRRVLPQVAPTPSRFGV